MEFKQQSKGGKNNNNARLSLSNILNDYEVKYTDLVRCLEMKDLKQFEQLANHVDLNKLQEHNKPYLFYAIEQNDKSMIKFLLEYDLDLTMKYLVDLTRIASAKDAANKSETNSKQQLTESQRTFNNTTTSSNEFTYNSKSSFFNDKNDEHRESSMIINTNISLNGKKELNAFEYSQLLERFDSSKIIKRKMTEPSIDEKIIRVILTRDIKEFKKFKERLKSTNEIQKYAQIGFMKAIEINSLNFVEYFLNVEHINVNCTVTNSEGLDTIPLLKAIENGSREVVSYLIFRGADIHAHGKYGDALVSAIHYDSTPDVVTLLLEKGALLTSRHVEWPKLSLREYCVHFSKVKAKLALDEFVCKLIAHGKYKKLKYLAENGYKHINVRNHLKKCGRDIAIERYHLNIVKLIDKLEENERRLNTKMNYK